MQIFSLDISTKTGWAFFENGELKDYGLITLPEKLKNMSYPDEFVLFASRMATKIKQVMDKVVPSDFYDQGMIVIEETSRGRAVYTHKILEFVHCFFLKKFAGSGYMIKYVRTGSWRSAVGMKLSKEDKEQNALVRKGLSRGLITKKHLSVRLVNKLFNMKLKLKNNDVSDAILVGLSAYKGVTYSKGMGSIKVGVDKDEIKEQ